MGSIITLSLGDHGGNHGLHEITAGTTVYLPVRAPWALFGIGDVHATMGDAEAHSGVTITAEIDVTLDVLHGESLERPWFETATHVMTVGVADDLTEALRQATAGMESGWCATRRDAHPGPHALRGGRGPAAWSGRRIRRAGERLRPVSEVGL